MRSIIEDIKKSNQFDLIIIDSPPLLIRLSYHFWICGCCGFNNQLKKVKRNLVQEAVKKIAITNSNFIGVVVNNTEESKGSINSNNSEFGYANKYMPQEVNERYANQIMKKINLTLKI